MKVSLQNMTQRDRKIFPLNTVLTIYTYLLFGGDSGKDSDVGKKAVKRPSIVQVLYVGHCLYRQRREERGEMERRKRHV